MEAMTYEEGDELSMMDSTAAPWLDHGEREGEGPSRMSWLVPYAHTLKTPEQRVYIIISACYNKTLWPKYRFFASGLVIIFFRQTDRLNFFDTVSAYGQRSVLRLVMHLLEKGQASKDIRLSALGRLIADHIFLANARAKSPAFGTAQPRQVCARDLKGRI